MWIFFASSWCDKNAWCQGKIRTVFDESAKSTDSVSINDVLHVEENLLPDLAESLLRWMKYTYLCICSWYATNVLADTSSWWWCKISNGFVAFKFWSEHRLLVFEHGDLRHNLKFFFGQSCCEAVGKGWRN